MIGALLWVFPLRVSAQDGGKPVQAHATQEFGAKFLPPQPILREVNADYLKQNNMTWNWWGVRDKMEDHGVVFIGSYTSEILANLTGGMQTGSIYDGLGVLGLTLDTEKMTEGTWGGGTFRVLAEYDHGHSLSEHYVGDLLGVSNMGPSGDAWSLDFSFEQVLFDEQLVTTLGYMGPGDLFALNSATSVFGNSAFGFPEIISGRPVQGPYSNSEPGFVIKYAPIREFYFQAGAYAGSEPTERNTTTQGSGIEIAIHDNLGVLGMMEAGYKLNQDPDHQEALPGNYRLGGWYRTRDDQTPSLASTRAQLFNYNSLKALYGAAQPFADYQNLLQNTFDLSDHAGLYVSADQMLYRPLKSDVQGLTAFYRLGSNLSGTTRFDFYTDGGLSYCGLIPSRKRDVVAVGVAYAKASNYERNISSGYNSIFPGYGAVSDYETVVEWTYSMQLTGFWSVQPDFQCVLHPGSSSQLQDAWVIGFRNIFYF